MSHWSVTLKRLVRQPWAFEVTFSSMGFIPRDPIVRLAPFVTRIIFTFRCACYDNGIINVNKGYSTAPRPLIIEAWSLLIFTVLWPWLDTVVCLNNWVQDIPSCLFSMGRSPDSSSSEGSSWLSAALDGPGWTPRCTVHCPAQRVSSWSHLGGYRFKSLCNVFHTSMSTYCIWSVNQV